LHASRATVADFTAAYHLLRDLLPLSLATVTLDTVLRSAGARLVIPVDPVGQAASPERMPQPVRELATLV
jgi:hypothetical protein